MSIICNTSDIKYTIIYVEKDEFGWGIEMVVNYLEDENEIDMNDLDVVADSANGVYGFIDNGKFWHPIVEVSNLDNHWTVPIYKEYEYDYMIILKGSPNELSTLITELTGDEKPYLESYYIWKTDDGIVAVIA